MKNGTLINSGKKWGIADLEFLPNSKQISVAVVKWKGYGNGWHSVQNTWGEPIYMGCYTYRWWSSYSYKYYTDTECLSPSVLEVSLNGEYSIWGVGTSALVYSSRLHIDTLSTCKDCEIQDVAISNQKVIGAVGSRSVFIKGLDENLPDYYFVRWPYNRLTSMDFSPDGNIFAVGSEDGSIIIWSTYSGEQIAVFSEHSSNVIEVAFSSDGNRLLSVSDDGMINIWGITP